MQPIKNIVQLRQLLAERLPNLRRFSALARRSRGEPARPTQLDALLQVALAKGCLSEVVSSPSKGGGALLIHWLLRRAHEVGQWMALVDGQDSFEPALVEQEILARLLWIRCRDATEVLKAADLLLRDDNFPIVALDLQLNPMKQLRRIPATAWYRFQRLIEHHGASLVVFSPQQLVSGAHTRLLLRNRFDLGSLEKTEEELFAQFQVEVTRLAGKEIGVSSEPAAQTG